jgi:hypothetical protein
MAERSFTAQSSIYQDFATRLRQPQRLGREKAPKDGFYAFFEGHGRGAL